jgi:thymidylate synthase (FAD)
MSDIVNELKGKTFSVLDQGFVRLVDVMGDDAAIVQAARVSYGEGTKTISDDRGLIRYCMRHRHTSIFEMAEVKLHVRVPMDVWRQWIRHRSANVNEYSTRYSLAIDAMQETTPGQWRLQAVDNKQGSGDYLRPIENSSVCIANNLSRKEHELHQHARDVYMHRIGCGIAREQARKDLPLSTYTEAYWKIDLHNLLHFLGLRMDSHAQLEIRQYATTIGEQIVAPLFPIAWQAFLDYRFNATSLSALEQRAIVEREFRPACLQVEYGMSKREVGEYLEKCEKLGLVTK